MGWLRKRTPRPDPAPAQEAKEQTRRDLSRVQSRRPLVMQLRDDLVAAREENHFAARIRSSLRGGPLNGLA